MGETRTLADAQADLRRAYVGGGPGLLISGAFWLLAAYVLSLRGLATAYAVLFFSGMLIFPLATLVVRYGFHRQPEMTGNKLGRIALESTIAMIAGLVMAWLVQSVRPAWTFPFAAIAVGTHFFAFRTAYGDWRFWLLGALMTVVGAAEAFGLTRLADHLPLAIGLLEIAFGAWMTIGNLRETKLAD